MLEESLSNCLQVIQSLNKGEEMSEREISNVTHNIYAWPSHGAALGSNPDNFGQKSFNTSQLTSTLDRFVRNNLINKSSGRGACPA